MQQEQYNPTVCTPMLEQWRLFIQSEKSIAIFKYLTSPNSFQKEFAFNSHHSARRSFPLVEPQIWGWMVEAGLLLLLLAASLPSLRRTRHPLVAAASSRAGGGLWSLHGPPPPTKHRRLDQRRYVPWESIIEFVIRLAVVLSTTSREHHRFPVSMFTGLLVVCHQRQLRRAGTPRGFWRRGRQELCCLRRRRRHGL